MTITDGQAQIARTMGEHAGQAFVDTGIWPTCPFKGDHPTQKQLRAAWVDGSFEVIGAALARLRSR